MGFRFASALIRRVVAGSLATGITVVLLAPSVSANDAGASRAGLEAALGDTSWINEDAPLAAEASIDDPGVVAFASGGVVRQPYLTLVTETSATLGWRTNNSTDSVVNYGTVQGSLTSSASDPTIVTDHFVTVSGLSPGTKYFYNVGDSDPSVHAGGTADHYFVTAPPTGSSNPFTLWAVGDGGTGTSTQIDVMDAMLAENGGSSPDLALYLGDIAYNSGTDSEFTTNYFAPYDPVLRNTPVWPVLGNHDGYSTTSGECAPLPCTAVSIGPYYDAFVLPTGAEAGGVASGTEAYYSFNYANTHFIALNSYEVSRSATGPMAQWLTADLVSTSAQWTVVFFHHPPYSKGTHDSDTEIELIEMRENILPILEAAGVDVVLAGHSHNYERSYLIDGTYSTPTPSFAALSAAGNIVDSGDGRVTGDGAYSKSSGAQPNEGAVYVVAGHGGRGTGGVLNHPVMFFSENANGSVLIDVSSTDLTLRNVRVDGTVTDSFSITKVLSCVTPADCADLTDDCNVGDCSGDGICVAVPEPDSTPCDDSSDCTVTDVCTSGSCAGDPIDCGGLVCDPLDGECVECASDLDCGAGEVCSAIRTCVPGPVTVNFEQGVGGYGGTVDTELNSALPDQDNSAVTTLVVDFEPSVRQVLMRFGSLFVSEGGVIPDGAMITSATLTVNITNASQQGASLHRMLQGWVDTDTWNTLSGGIQADDVEAAATPDITDPGSAVGLHVIDVTSSLAAWSAGGANHGWAWLQSVNDSWRFGSSESATPPRLSVSYELASCSIDGDCDDGDPCTTDRCEDDYQCVYSTDYDQDNLEVCAGDCDDANASIYPGAPEINDGLDNQCSGDYGYGLVDESSGESGFHNLSDRTELSWPDQVGATSFEVARSSSSDFSVDCIRVTRTSAYWNDLETPDLGTGFFYLVRPLTPYAGSWGKDSTGTERTTICPLNTNVILDGGMEVWTSSTDLSTWREIRAAGTIDQESDPGSVYKGDSAARLTRTSAGVFNIMQTSIPLVPGADYRLELAAMFSETRPGALQVRIQNFTRGEELRADGSWSAGYYYFNLDLTTTYQRYALDFTVDAGYDATDDFRLIIRHNNGTPTPIGSEMWIDDVAIRAQ